MGDCQARFREKGGVKLPSTYSTEICIMKLSTGQKKELKGMLTFLVASIIVWLLASLVLHFPWNHTLILTALSVVISIIQTAFIVFRRNKEDE